MLRWIGGLGGGGTPRKAPPLGVRPAPGHSPLAWSSPVWLAFSCIDTSQSCRLGLLGVAVGMEVGPEGASSHRIGTSLTPPCPQPYRLLSIGAAAAFELGGLDWVRNVELSSPSSMLSNSRMPELLSNSGGMGSTSSIVSAQLSGLVADGQHSPL